MMIKSCVYYTRITHIHVQAPMSNLPFLDVPLQKNQQLFVFFQISTETIQNGMPISEMHLNIPCGYI